MGHLETKDARTGEEQGAIAQLIEALHVIIMDHRIDDVYLVAIGLGQSGDLQELKGQQVCGHTHPLIRVSPVGEEQDDSLLGLGHGPVGTS